MFIVHDDQALHHNHWQLPGEEIGGVKICPTCGGHGLISRPEPKEFLWHIGFAVAAVIVIGLVLKIAWSAVT